MTHAPGGTGRRENLRRLLAPQSVAIIGGRDAAVALRQCVGIGFEGEIWFVNPRGREMQGRPGFASVEALPAAPDAAFVAVRSEATVEVVRALARRGAGGCVCYAAGFAEIGESGARLQRALVEAAGDMALVGPNCYGLLNYLDGVTLWPDEHGGRVVERGAAFVSQSGNMSLSVSCQDRSLPLAYVISVGNQAMLGPAELIEALIEDPRVSAIGLYIEGLTDVAGFSRAAAAALARGVPLVALKAGSSEIGARLALTHTSSLAGSEALYAALFERLGVIRVTSLGALLETLKLLCVSGPPAGPRLVSLSCSGGDAALVADRGAPLGLRFPPFSEAQSGALRAQLPDFVTISNPFDYNTSIWADAAAMERCFTTVLGGEAQAGLLVLDYPVPREASYPDWDAALDALIAARRATGTPAAVASTLVELLPRAARERALAGGVTPLQGLDDALAALAGGAWYGARRARLAAAAAALAVPAPGPAPAAPVLLGEWQSKRLLAEFGVAVPEGRRVRAGEAAAAAAQLGYPVAVKAAGVPLAHKSEAGALALGIADAAALEAAIVAIGRALAAVPGAAEWLLVERMVEGAVAELLLGVRRDAQFGPALVLGSGGVLVELAGDTRTLLLPVSRAQVEEALDGLKAARLLAGYRGRPTGDREAAVEAVLAVAAFAEAHREGLEELDVNPLLVLPAGRGAVAADALISMSREERGG